MKFSLMIKMKGGTGNDASMAFGFQRTQFMHPVALMVRVGAMVKRVVG